MAKTVLLRIRRLGVQSASCGVPVRPPEHLVGDPSMKRRCPKLVPGQVIELPADHNLTRQPAIEFVRRIEKDEVLRPWVYETAEDAILGNPHKSRLSADQIEAGLAMSEGAIANRAHEHEERERARSVANPVLDHEDDEDEVVSEEDAYEDEADNAKRSRNRTPSTIYDDAKSVEDEPTKPVRRGRRRT